MRVFVYGSLKKGFHNHRLLETSKFLGHHVTEPLFEMVSLGGFPGVFQMGDTPISGEVYEIDEATFQRLDRLEGYPSFYTRVEISTPWGYSWIYILNEDRDNDYSKIESGLWSWENA